MSILKHGVSVPEAVHQILVRNYPIYECLKMRLINYHSLAEYVQPHVEEANVEQTRSNVAKLTLFLSLGGEMTPGISSYITELL